MASPKEVLAMESGNIIVRLLNNEGSNTGERRIEELRRLFRINEIKSIYGLRLPHLPELAVKEFDSLVGENAAVVELNLPAILLNAIVNESEFAKRGGIFVRPRDVAPNEVYSHKYEQIVGIKLEIRPLE
jgi:hypothetical protein